MKYKCIIFDCDGILVDSEEISNSILVEMANEIGAKIEMEYALESFAGKSLKSCLEYIEKRIEKPLPNEFEKKFRSRTFSAFKTDLKPIEGIHNLLDQIEIPFCVASSGPVEKIRLNLTTTHLIEKFENRIFSSYEIGSWKPNPRIFEYAAEEMGFKPNQCAVIEDSMVGIKAGLNGGFDVYALVNQKNKDEFKKAGAQVFFGMNELYELLN
ncbi:HAD family hydrolase [Flagellimonas meridianipacifica]|uniref:HAD superfamily hydrolase (TIGR01509 family)/HAD superfamily hydrolase (TIGR01549 family) n=1 Tax=Flagellimonas meridianipacifica TaxID=1080225 RepID=A0A2T0M9H6_9FLAO|nr:HAD family hydrolase [Allomuricauda pacifica]PRX54186.1 HAD superfamily hydrolase (TIGR01509 family)/HAD superfamily hydrolase (TIGR01549 family) [Allomuricauda pacifica]